MPSKHLFLSIKLTLDLYNCLFYNNSTGEQMNIEQEIFQRAKLNLKKAKKFGFKKEGDNYLIYKTFPTLSFQAEIRMDKEGMVKGIVRDLETQEEYQNFRIESQKGSFVQKVREEYKILLKEIYEYCFDKRYFLFEQANKISAYIKEKYGVEPEFLWEKYPGFGIFRNPINQKWFALIAGVDSSKIRDSKGEVEILNLSVEKENLEQYLGVKGIYKAYHMNKKKWISVVLDGTMEESEIKKLVDKSYDLVALKK